MDTNALRRGFGAAAGRTAQLAAYHCACQEAAAEIDRLREQMEWQPIETAPKDGTHILVYAIPEASPDDWSDMVTEAWWGEDDDEGRMCWVGYGLTYWHVATHWMPLPTPLVGS